MSENGKPDAAHQVWAVSHRNGWSRVPDPVQGATNDYEKALTKAGYTELTAWPHRDATTWIQVYEGEGRENFLVCFNTLYSAHTIAVADLPSLLDLLHRLLPLVEAGARLDKLQDDNDQEREERRAEQREKAMQARIRAIELGGT